MKISVGEHEVLDSGVVLSPHDSPIKFELVHNQEELTITVSFLESTEKDDKGKSIDTSKMSLVSDSEMNIVLNGWNSPLGVATTDYWDIGTIGGRKLRFIMRISGIKMDDGIHRMFAYTWLLGDPL